MLFEFVGWGSLIAVVLGVVAPILFAAAMKIFTRVNGWVTTTMAVSASAIVLTVSTIVLTGVALNAGPVALIVPIAAAICFFVTVTKVALVGLFPRGVD